MKTPRRMKRFWLLLLIVGGMLIVFGGFIDDVMFAGIPYQDPTPEMTASYARHSGIASMICWCGAAIFLFGVVAGVIRRVNRKPSVKNYGRDVSGRQEQITSRELNRIPILSQWSASREQYDRTYMRIE